MYTVHARVIAVITHPPALCMYALFMLYASHEVCVSTSGITLALDFECIISHAGILTFTKPHAWTLAVSVSVLL